MTQIKVEGDIAADIDAVWKLVSDFVGFLTAQGLDCTGEGDGIGMERAIKVGSSTVVERLESLDEAARRTSYTIVSGPLPVRDYTGTIQLTAGGEDATTLTWSGSFQPEGISDEQAIEMMEQVYQGGIKSLQKHFAG